MANQAKPKPNSSRVIVVILILVALFCSYLLYRSSSGGENSCSSLRSLYENAKEVEDYGKVSEYFGKMNELGCEF